MTSADPVMLWQPWFRWVMGALLAITIVRGWTSWSSVVVALMLGHDWGVWEQRKQTRPTSWKRIQRVLELSVRIAIREQSLPWGVRHLYTFARTVQAIGLMSLLNAREREVLRSISEPDESEAA